MSISRFFGIHAFSRFENYGHQRHVGYGGYHGFRPEHGYRGHDYRHHAPQRGFHHRGWWG